MIDKLNLGLQEDRSRLKLEEVGAQVAKLFPSAGTGDTFSDAQIQLVDRSQRGTVHTTEHLPGCFCLGPRLLRYYM